MAKMMQSKNMAKNNHFPISLDGLWVLQNNCPRNLNKESIDLYLVLQYFFPFAQEGIDNLIEDAFLSADKLGVKVISLTTLNKVDPTFRHLSLYLILKVKGHVPRSLYSLSCILSYFDGCRVKGYFNYVESWNLHNFLLHNY